MAANFKERDDEVGIYLAMARQAQRGGYPEIGRHLRESQEKKPGCMQPDALGSTDLSPENTKENLERMLNGEIGANRGKKLR